MYELEYGCGVYILYVLYVPAPEMSPGTGGGAACTGGRNKRKSRATHGTASSFCTKRYIPNVHVDMCIYVGMIYCMAILI